MRKIGAYAVIAATGLSLAAALPASPAAAFGLRIGPFHIGIPFFGHHHRHLYMRAAPAERATEEAPARPTTSALVYPSVALSSIFQNIFWPAYASPWPFGYQDIFTAGFARTPTTPDRRLCQQTDNSQAIVGRIREDIAPTDDQMPLLQKLGGAAGAASGYLAKSCPKEIPAQPVARLQLMESQIQELTMALDIIRQPLQDFTQSLDDEQKARFAAMIEGQAPAATDRRGQSALTQSDMAQSCAGTPSVVDWSVDRIDRAVQPNADQREALAGMKKSFGTAVTDLEAHCPTMVPPTALGRLEAIQARLDSTWRAVLSIQVALANFETKLSDAQRTRFDTTNFAAR